MMTGNTVRNPRPVSMTKPAGRVLLKTVDSRGEKIQLVRLYTPAPLWVDLSQLANPNRIQLSIYTACGNRLCDVLDRAGNYSRGTTVHRENLFATPDLANAHRERIYTDITRRSLGGKENED